MSNQNDLLQDQGVDKPIVPDEQGNTDANLNDTDVLSKDETDQDSEILDAEVIEESKSPSETNSQGQGIFTRYMYPDKEESLSRKGFHCAVDAVSDPRPEFRALLEELKKNKAKELQDNHSAKLLNEDRIKGRINLMASKIEEAKAEINEYNAQMESLTIQREEASNELVIKKKELQDTYADLAEEERKLIPERIKQTKDELTQIIESYGSFFKSDTPRSGKREDVGALKNILSNIKAKLDSLQKHIQSFSAAGFSSRELGFLRGGGYAGVLAAGWFFAIYAMFINGMIDGSKSILFDSQDYLSQAIKRLFTINPAGTGSGVWVNFGTGIGIFIILLIVVTLIARYSHYLLENIFEKRALSRISARTKRGGSVSFNASVNAQSFYAFWIQILPAVFLLGFIFVLAMLWGVGNESEMDKASRYAASFTFGISIALAFAGLATIYIAKIIEPRLKFRLKKIEEQDENVNFLRENWELTFSFVFFLISTVLLVLIDGQGTSNWMSTLLLMEFVSIMLVSGFAMGYAIRYSGAIFLSKVFEFQYLNTAIQIETIENPTMLNDFSATGQKFKKRLNTLQSQLIDLIEGKNTRAINVVNEEPAWVTEKQRQKSKGKKSFFNRLVDDSRGFFVSIFTPKGKKKETDEIPLDKDIYPGQVYQQPVTITNSLAQDYFSPFQKLISDLEEEMNRLKTKILNLDLELNAIRKRRSNFEIARKNRIQRWYQSINDLKKQLVKNEVDWQQKVEHLEYLYSRYEYALRDGYMLGIWCRENNISPKDFFYPKIKV